MAMEPSYVVTLRYWDGVEENYPVLDYAEKEGVLTLVRPALPLRYIPLVGLRWYDATGVARAADDGAVPAPRPPATTALWYR